MKTLYERLLWIAREVGIQEKDNKAVAAVIGRTPGRATQIKQGGEAARIDGDALQRVVQRGFSAKWVNEGKGEPRIKDATFALPTNEGVSLETKADHVADALFLILKAAGFEADALGAKGEIINTLVTKASRKSDESHSQDVAHVAIEENDKCDNLYRQKSGRAAQSWDVPLDIKPAESDEKKSLGDKP